MFKTLPSILFILFSFSVQAQEINTQQPDDESLKIKEDTIPPLIFGNPFVLLQGESLEDVMVNYNPDAAIYSLFPFLQEVDVVIGTAYVDMGVEIFDESQLDGASPTLTIEGIEDIDTSTPTPPNEPFVIKYIATDEAGNRSELLRFVNVIGVDVEAPIILLVEDDPLNPNDDDVDAFAEVEIGGMWEEPGFYAYDNVDGLITDNVVMGGDIVNIGQIGGYTVTYDVIDKAGNWTTNVRYLNVRDTTPPVVTPLGPIPQVITCNCPYIEYGAEAFDVIDGQVEIFSIQIFDNTGNQVSWDYEPIPPGLYLIKYSASDCKGNIGTASRLLNIQEVEDCNAPCIVGIEDQLLQSDISFYPNPTQNHFFIDFKDLVFLQNQAQIEVHNLMGESVHIVQSLPNKEQILKIDLTNQVTGIYFVKIQTSEGTLTKKVVLRN